MTVINRRFPRGMKAVLLGAALAAPAAVLADGQVGEHVERFEEHLADYEADVEALGDRLDTIVSDYREGPEQAQAALEDFIKAWREVEYHSAVEVVSTPLYSPIWRGITDLRQAVEEERGVEAVEQQAEALRNALREGLGGLKLQAAQGAQVDDGHADDGHAEEGSTGPVAVLDAIREALDEAVAAYEQGDAEQARSLVETAYFERFEGIEGGLIEQDPQLVTRLEEAFNAELPGLIVEGAPAGDVEAKVASMKDALSRCEELLTGSDEGGSEVF